LFTSTPGSKKICVNKITSATEGKRGVAVARWGGITEGERNGKRWKEALLRQAGRRRQQRVLIHTV